MLCESTYFTKHVQLKYGQFIGRRRKVTCKIGRSRWIYLLIVAPVDTTVLADLATTALNLVMFNCMCWHSGGPPMSKRAKTRSSLTSIVMGFTI